MGFTNSPLVSYTQISPCKNKNRKYAITRITVHCYVGQVTVERMGKGWANIFANASANYGIGTDGRIGLYVEEKDRSWCSSSPDNDNRAVTIECASDTKEPYAVNGNVYASLINLVTDICQRNGINKLIWFGDKTKTLNYVCKEGEAVMTVHRWFANKSCPGSYLYNLHGQIAAEVNARLGGGSAVNYMYQGVNYNKVFDPTQYANRYRDLKNAFGNNATKLFNHFCEYGMKEGRQAIDGFNVTVYRANNADLQKAFGSDLPAYYKHYCQYGYKEGRKCV